MVKENVKQVFIAYGSNLGDWIQIKTACFALISAKVGNIKKQSKTYITPAWGKLDQADFKNGVLQVETTKPANECLKLLLNIENTLGRVRAEKWGPRLIDLDIIDYNHEVLQTESLTLPHPFASERQFVLEPLVEIAHDLKLGGHKLTCSELLERLPNKEPLEVLE